MDAPPGSGRTKWIVAGCCALGLLAALALLLPWLLASQRISSESPPTTALKTLVVAEADFRSNDRDLNQKSDFWVGDVAGLYGLAGEGGGPMRLIELSVALADRAPVVDLSKFAPMVPRAGYCYAAIPLQADGKPYDDGSHRHAQAFAFCAWPADPKSLRKTFIINEDSTMHMKAISPPARIARWPADPAAEGWTRMD
ncbi:MAG: hypothetical protein HY293_15320 [Planctomycetes bacterium]|nr:hypothetical protein [Planctomycetota bacterium]